MTDFAIGDVVRLKSLEGPKMTVVSEEPEEHGLTCCWHLADGNSTGAQFPTVCLVLADAPAPAPPLQDFVVTEAMVSKGLVEVRKAASQIIGAYDLLQIYRAMETERRRGEHP